MKRLFFATLVVCLSACTSDAPDGPGGDGDDDGDTDCVVECATSNQCEIGKWCTEFCCEELIVCQPGRCPPGEFCAPDGLCRSVGQFCVGAACECNITNTAGQFVASGDAVISLPGGATHTVGVGLAIVGGESLPGGNFTITSADPSVVSVANGVELTAGASAGSTTITAALDEDPNVTCEATVTVLGSAATDEVRFFVYNDQTGEAITGATIIVDTTGSGTDSGSVEVLQDGLYQTTTSAVTGAGTYSLTVFVEGYNYLTMVDLSGATTDVSVPMSARVANSNSAILGGHTGKIDWEGYEKNFLSGNEKAIKLALVGTSFSLASLLNFSFDLFVGRIADVDCDDIPRPAGCYKVDITNPVTFEGILPLPGGLVIHLFGNAVKAHFDTVGQPGRRHAWTLGGEVNLGELGDLLNVLEALFDPPECACDSTNECDAGCGCDSDCGLALDFGAIFNGIVPLFVQFASGVQGNLPLITSTQAAWDAHIGSREYDLRSDSDLFPKLDDDTAYGRLGLPQGLTNFTVFATPTLPDGMEGMVVLTGTNALGSGFVPLGLGIGLDCTTDNCLDPASEDYDGEINKGTVCAYHVDDSRTGCPPGVTDLAPLGILGDNKIGLFHAANHGGLQGQDRFTMAVAIPITGLAGGDVSGFRGSAIVVRGDLPVGVSSSNALTTGTFPPIPDLGSATGRTYTVASNGYDLQWLTFSTADYSDATNHPQNGKQTVRWNVFLPKAGGTFVAPGVPAALNIDGFRDPMGGSPDGLGDIDTGEINITRLGFDLGTSSADLDSYAANNGTNITNVVEDLAGFGARNGDISR